MDVIIHNCGSKIAEFCSNKIILNIAQDALDLIAIASEKDASKNHIT